MRIRSIYQTSKTDDDVNLGLERLARTEWMPTMTETEAAHYIGMSGAWLKKSRTIRFRGVIDAPPFIRAGARRVLYRRDDLDGWQERHLERVGPGEHRIDTSASTGLSRAGDQST